MFASLHPKPEEKREVFSFVVVQKEEMASNEIGSRGIQVTRSEKWEEREREERAKVIKDEGVSVGGLFLFHPHFRVGAQFHVIFEPAHLLKK